MDALAVGIVVVSAVFFMVVFGLWLVEQQPLVPTTILSGGGDDQQSGLFGTLMSLLVAEKMGIKVPTPSQKELVVPGIEIEK